MQEKRTIVATIKTFDESDLMMLGWAIQDAKTAGQKILPIIIRSPGGGVYNLNGLIDMIQNSGLEIWTIAHGLTMSAGAVLFTFGKRRFITENATGMIHAAIGKTWGSLPEIKAEANEIERLNDKLFGFLDSNTGNQPGFFRSKLKELEGGNLYITPEMALEMNFATDIGAPSINDISRPEGGLYPLTEQDDNMKILFSLNSGSKYDRYPIKRKDRKVFAAGKFKGEVYTNFDVKNIYNHYQTLKSFLIPICRETHEGKYKVGEIEELYLKSNNKGNFEIFADYSVNNDIADKQDKGLLDSVSLEILPKFERQDGKVFKNVIVGLSLEGAKQPALVEIEGIKQFSLEDELKDFGCKFNEKNLIICKLEDNEDMPQEEKGNKDTGNTFTMKQVTGMIAESQTAMINQFKEELAANQVLLEKQAEERYQAEYNNLIAETSAKLAKYEAETAKLTQKETNDWLIKMQSKDVNVLNAKSAKIAKTFIETFLNEDNKVKTFALEDGENKKDVSMSAKDLFKDFVENLPKNLSHEMQLPDKQALNLNLTKRQLDELKLYEVRDPKMYKQLIKGYEKDADMKSKGLDPTKLEDIRKYNSMV